MPVVDVVNLKGNKVGQLDLLDAVFGVKVNQHLLHEASRWYLRGLRRGTHKTKEFLGVLGKLNHKKSALIVAHGENTNLERASRNIEGVTLVAPNGLQPYDLLKHDLLVLSKEAVARLSHWLDPEKTPAATPDVETIAPAPKRETKPAAKPAPAKKPKAAAKKPAKTAKKKGKE